MKHLIISGPQASGKTRLAEFIKATSNKVIVIEGVNLEFIKHFNTNNVNNGVVYVFTTQDDLKDVELRRFEVIKLTL